MFEFHSNTEISVDFRLFYDDREKIDKEITICIDLSYRNVLDFKSGEQMLNLLIYWLDG